jgi:hypothetical protein
MKRLPQSIVKQINARIDNLFDKIKFRFLGSVKGPGKELRIKFDRKLSLPGIYETATAIEGGVPDKQLLNQMVESAGNYIDSVRLNAKSKLVNQIQAFVTESESNPLTTEEIHAKLSDDLTELWDNVGSQLKRVVDTESQHTRNIGALDGITHVNASVGVEDPIVFWVVVRDDSLCKECKKLHMFDDVTPRVWKLSEIGHDFHHRGEPAPKIGGLHPNCRCSMTTLMPGFGFDSGGKVTWIKDGHDEYKKQHGTSS